MAPSPSIRRSVRRSVERIASSSLNLMKAKGLAQRLVLRWQKATAQLVVGLVQLRVIAGTRLAMQLEQINKPSAWAGSGAGTKLAPKLAVGLE